MKLLILLTAFAASVPAAAQDPRLSPSPEYAACLTRGDAERGNAAAIDLCIGAEQALQDRRLADSFKRTSDEHGWKGQDYLRDVQAAWRKDSAARCSAQVAADPRKSMTSRLYQICILDETIARIAWLDDYPPE